MSRKQKLLIGVCLGTGLWFVPILVGHQSVPDFIFGQVSAAQFGRPSNDVSNNSWSAAPLWEKLDETTTDNETTQISSRTNPASGDFFEVALSSLSDPQSSTGHVLRYRLLKTQAKSIQATVYLYQGSSLIATTPVQSPGSAYTTYSYTLTGAEANSITNYSDLRVRLVPSTSGGGKPGELFATWIEFEVPDAPALLSVDIVDAVGASVSNPTVSLSSLTTAFDCQTSTGTFGVSSQKVRVSNLTSTPPWTLTIAPTAGAAVTWTNGLSSYDFNDAGGSPAGCADGVDLDALAGQLTLNPAVAVLTAKPGCSNTGVNLGGISSYADGSVNSVTLLTASGAANTNCYWDLTNIGVSQRIPAETPSATYTLNLTLTLTAN